MTQAIIEQIAMEELSFYGEKGMHATVSMLCQLLSITNVHEVRKIARAVACKQFAGSLGVPVSAVKSSPINSINTFKDWVLYHEIKSNPAMNGQGEVVQQLLQKRLDEYSFGLLSTQSGEESVKVLLKRIECSLGFKNKNHLLQHLVSTLKKIKTISPDRNYANLQMSIPVVNYGLQQLLPAIDHFASTKTGWLNEAQLSVIRAKTIVVAASSVDLALFSSRSADEEKIEPGNVTVMAQFMAWFWLTDEIFDIDQASFPDEVIIATSSLISSIMSRKGQQLEEKTDGVESALAKQLTKPLDFLMSHQLFKDFAEMAPKLYQQFQLSTVAHMTGKIEEKMTGNVKQSLLSRRVSSAVTPCMYLWIFERLRRQPQLVYVLDNMIGKNENILHALCHGVDKANIDISIFNDAVSIVDDVTDRDMNYGFFCALRSVPEGMYADLVVRRDASREMGLMEEDKVIGEIRRLSAAAWLEHPLCLEMMKREAIVEASELSRVKARRAAKATIPAMLVLKGTLIKSGVSEGTSHAIFESVCKSLLIFQNGNRTWSGCTIKYVKTLNFLKD